MSTDVLANFTCLDELIQVIYQGVHRFVVLSTVTDQWTIHLGLSGPEGRWWRGTWAKTDILEIVGSKSSDKLLEAFADKLAETFTQGELYIGDWSPEKGAKIKLTLGPASKKPLHISLIELTSAEAASHATDVLLDIALQARSRKCSLHPGQFASSYVSSKPPTEKAIDTTTSVTTPSNISRRVIPSTHGALPVDQQRHVAGTDGQTEALKTSKSEVEKPKQRASSMDPKIKSAAPKQLKGASLANPNKKARKYQAIEFESDEE